jgi:nitrite reductase/ring-hydroxylating ferredoxin subunit
MIMSVKKLERNFLQRLFGISATKKPSDTGCWRVSGKRIELDLSKCPELTVTGGSVRLDGGGLETSVLVVQDAEGRYHAFKNVCTHGKRALDPVPGTSTVQCCSIGTSTFDYDGKLLEGPAKGPLTVYRVEQEGNILGITM